MIFFNIFQIDKSTVIYFHISILKYVFLSSMLITETRSFSHQMSYDIGQIKTNSSFDFNISDFDKNLRELGWKSKHKKYFCNAANYLENNGKNRHGLISVQTYDTLTQSDIVRTQYANLPYPAVKLEWLNREKLYYDSMEWPVNAYGKLRNKPMRVSYGITLEAINHFLYQGKNNFR